VGVVCGWVWCECGWVWCECGWCGLSVGGCGVSVGGCGMSVGGVVWCGVGGCGMSVGLPAILVQGFSDPLQHCIRTQNSVTSLHGRFRAEKTSI